MPHNIAAWRVTLAGRDLTDALAPRLISLTLTEKRGEEADQLDLVLDDADGKLALPSKGVEIRVSLGWKQGDDIEPGFVGLVDKGRFKVDEVEHSGAPDIITVRARSADLAAGYRVRREKAWAETTIGAIVRSVAAANGLAAQVASDLAAIEVPVLAQSEASDMALVRRLGRRHDAVATIKDGKLLFARIGTGTTATGKPIPPGTITRASGDRHRYALVDRDSKYDGVEARWHDPDAAERKTVRVGGGSAGGAGGGAGGEAPRAKRLKKIYATQADAKAAATAEAGRIRRRGAEFELSLALGRPDLYPDRPITVKGWKPEIDARKWLLAEATHTLDARGGLTTRIKLEIA